MHLVDSFWTSITYVVSFLTLSPVQGPGGEEQAPLLPSSDALHHENLRGPIFKPPGGRLTGPGSDFTCDYSRMSGWSNCSTPFNRGCWLRNDETGQEFNVSTDYEDTNQTPIGIHRTYYLNITDGWYNADGLNFTQAKLFNGTYPGPWIQACWGDNVTIIVNNTLKSNGTSVHWHGIRQWRTMHMDGVNGVTQCPIAPGDYFNYTWRVMQYGSSWYHSHYSVQYADGAVGPITLHGPSTAPYDEAKTPTLMTDWGHNSAFEAIWTDLELPTILLNGTGNINRYYGKCKNQSQIPDPYTITFDPPPPDGRPKRYLLRLINTSFDSTFVFAIDNHFLEIVGADFVPIHPYRSTSVLVGIGQRYHVVVTANPEPDGHPLPDDGNYWIRTWKAECFGFKPSRLGPHYQQTGILRYNASSQADPTSNASKPDTTCSDEPYASLQPYFPWTVGPAANAPPNPPPNKIGQNFSVSNQDGHNIFPLAVFSIGGDDPDFNPLKIDYSNPIFLNLNYSGKWNPLWVVFSENYTDGDWVYMVLKGPESKPHHGAHPIHLHGHDFAILAQVGNATFPHHLQLKTDNPPRRDVVLLPTDGYAVIAFKTDNPGSWLVHCHIADHASLGLALQILERQTDAAGIWPSLAESNALKNAQRVCDNWNEWWGNCSNWWHPDDRPSSCGTGELAFSPDSGI